jgi:hypothetical protein
MPKLTCIKSFTDELNTFRSRRFYIALALATTFWPIDHAAPGPVRHRALTCYLKAVLSPPYKSHSTPAAPRAQIHLCVLPHLRRFKIFVTQLIR